MMVYLLKAGSHGYHVREKDTAVVFLLHDGTVHYLENHQQRSVHGYTWKALTGNPEFFTGLGTFADDSAIGNVFHEAQPHHKIPLEVLTNDG